MEQVFRYPKVLTVFTCIFSVVFFAGGVFMISTSFNEPDGGKIGVMIVFGAGMLVLGTYGFVGMYYSKIVVSAQSITYNSGWRTRQLMIAEIKGYHLSGKHLTIYPRQKDKPKIVVTDLFVWSKWKQLRYWLTQNIPDLYAMDFKAETQEIAYDNRIGVNDAHRLKRAATARKVVTCLTISSAVLAGLTIYVFPVNDALVVVLLIFPVLCVLLMQYYKGVVRFDGKEKGAYPTIGGAMMLAGLGIAGKAMLNYSLYSYTNIWAVTGLVTLILIILIDRITINEPRASSKFSRMFYMAIFALSYSYGGVTMINCFYDQSAPMMHKAAVIKKYSSFDKVMTYHFTLSAWGNKPSGEEESVQRPVYNKTTEGDSVQIILKKGSLDMPWYYITN